MLSAGPVCSCARSCAQSAHETAGAARPRSSLRPLFSERAKQDANLGQFMSRDREIMSAREIKSAVECKSLSAVIARSDSDEAIHASVMPHDGLLRFARNDDPETAMVESSSRGVLDAPPARGMTTVDAVKGCQGTPRRPLFLFHAVFAAFSPSFSSTASRIKNFWILPVTVIGNSSTNST